MKKQNTVNINVDTGIRDILNEFTDETGLKRNYALSVMIMFIIMECKTAENFKKWLYEAEDRLTKAGIKIDDIEQLRQFIAHPPIVPKLI